MPGRYYKKKSKDARTGETLENRRKRKLPERMRETHNTVTKRGKKRRLMQLYSEY